MGSATAGYTCTCTHKAQQQRDGRCNGLRVLFLLLLQCAVHKASNNGARRMRQCQLAWHAAGIACSASLTSAQGNAEWNIITLR